MGFLCNLKKNNYNYENFFFILKFFFPSFWKSFSSFCSAKSVLASWIFLHFSVFFSSFCKFFSSFCKKSTKNAFLDCSNYSDHLDQILPQKTITPFFINGRNFQNVCTAFCTAFWLDWLDINIYRVNQTTPINKPA